MTHFPKYLFFVGIGVLVFSTLRFSPTLMEGGGGISVSGVHDIMQAVISVIVLCASLFVILSKRYASSDKHWAYTAIGTILGFWLPK